VLASLAAGDSVEDILADFPALKPEIPNSGAKTKGAACAALL
jgi:hypothetical protein